MLTRTISRGATRHRRLLLAVLVGLLLLCAAVVADRILARAAGDRLARRVQCVAGLARPPRVTVRGFPFLPQAFGGRYRRIDVAARDLTRGGLRLATVRAALRDTTIAGGTASIGAARVEAVVGFDALPGRFGGHDVTYREADGLLAISTTATLAGRNLPVTLLASPRIGDGSLRVEPREVEVLGIRRPAANLLRRLGAPDIDRRLPRLPAGLAYADVAVRPEGLAVTVTGTDLTLGARGTGTTVRSGSASSPAASAAASPAASAARSPAASAAPTSAASAAPSPATPAVPSAAPCGAPR